MPSYTQEDRMFKIDTPLGKDALLLRGFRGTEGISRLFRFELDLLSENSSISFKDIVGQNVTISLKQSDGSYRYFNGFVSRFGQSAREELFTAYHAEMVPWLWFLTRNANCRIFQNKTIPEIIKQVFSNLGFQDFSDRTQGSYSPREYCVQYRETDFHFVSRLMEEYGMFYFFEHDMGKHPLVLADDSSAHSDCPGQSRFPVTKVNVSMVEDVVTGWQVEQELRTGKYALTDYNFQTPSTDLLVNSPTLYSVGGNSKYETYDYPGKYLKKGAGQNLVNIRMQEEEARHLVIHGTSDARSMITGYKFTLKDHYRSDMNTSYVLTDIQHNASTDAYGTSQHLQGDAYSNAFQCIPTSVPFRPPRVTPRPTVMGLQTAVVVGPSGEEIHTDKYGRVKVQFFWDRLGKEDENSSCWIRVSQLFAGNTWGAMFLPRIGQEVIVDFLEGDPDQPLITGRVYNAEQMPPGSLPDHQNVSGWRTRSTKGGGDHNANVLAFDDTKGSENFYMRAEKDMNVAVEHDNNVKILNDQTVTIHNNRSVVIETGNDSLRIKMGNQSIKLDMGQSTTEAMQSITLKVGQSSIVLDPTGVTIKGMMISIQGQVQAEVKAVLTQVTADAILTCKGALTMIN